MISLKYIAVLAAGLAPIAMPYPSFAEPQPMALPDFSIERSCSLFAGHPRPLAFCLSQEANYRGEVTGMWAKVRGPDREKCTELASQSERGKYQVLSRCLRAAMSEAAWKDAVGTVKQ